MSSPKNWEEETKNIPMSSCKEAARLVSISCDRNLSWRENVLMRIHLMMCKTCTLYYKQTRALRKIFSSNEIFLNQECSSESECLCEQAKEKIKKALKEQA